MQRAHSRGFTLIELLVVIAIIAVLIGLLLPAVQKVREAAARTQSTNNLKQMSVAVQDCASNFDGQMPPAIGWFQGKNGTWFFHILPYIEQDNVWRTASTGTPIKTYYAPLDAGNPGNQPYTSYCLNANNPPNNPLFVNAPNNPLTSTTPNTYSRMPAAFGTKGSSNTIILGERFAVIGSTARQWNSTATTQGATSTWLDGTGNTAGNGATPTTGCIENPQVPYTSASAVKFHAFSAAGCQVTLGDGSARTVSMAVAPSTWAWACSVITTSPPPADW
jgi:prepilin-type N-terminal cleavage/methylation domain-containing protein